MIDDGYLFFLNGHNPETDELTRRALDDMKKSGLSPEILELAQVRIFSGKSDTLKERLGFSSINGNPILSMARLVEIPCFDASGNIIGYSYKPFPSIDGRKYLHPKGQPARPYILPDVRAVKDKPHKPLWITEGIKKALKLIQHSRSAISLAGVWNFRAAQDSEEGDGRYLWADLESFVWRGRTVYLGFDMDSSTNPQVRTALYELALKLISRGATVKFPSWHGAKGIDDYLAGQKNPDKALGELEDKALPLDKFIAPEHHAEILRALSLVFPALDDITRESLINRIAKALRVKSKLIYGEIAKRAEHTTGPGYTEEERQAAILLLKNPRLIKRFLRLMGKKYVGRHRELVMTKFVTMTRHFSRGTSLVVVGTSSVGKSALLEAVVSTVWPACKEDFTKITTNYLLYRTEPLSHKVFTIYERQGSDDAAYALRSALTEGTLSLGTVVDDAHGGLTTKDIQKDAEGMVLLMSFASGAMDAEFQTRVLTIELAHDEILARKVLQQKAGGREDISQELRLWQIADSLIKPLPVDVPFALKLANLFPVSQERHARDFDKVLNLVRASALLHQYQRTRNADGHVVADVRDYRLVYWMRELIAQSVATISKPMRRFLETAKGLAGHESPTRDELQAALACSPATMKRRISEAKKRDWITTDGRGRDTRITVVEIPAPASPLPEPRSIFSSNPGEPVSQSTETVDSGQSTSAHSCFDPIEPMSQTSGHDECNGSKTAQTAHSGSNGGEPTKSVDYQGFTQNGSMAQSETDKNISPLSTNEESFEMEVPALW